MAPSELSLYPSSDSDATGMESDEDDPYQTESKEVYVGKPLAEEEWLALYKEDMKTEWKLTKWLHRTKKVWEW